jgi:hypothetical protein
MRYHAWAIAVLAVVLVLGAAGFAIAQESSSFSDSTASAPDAAAAQTTPVDSPASGGVTAPPAGSNLLNPNISAIGWFQGQAGDAHDRTDTSAFQLREVELGYQATVDPYSRADFFISVSPDEGIDVEEGYLTLLTLPAGFTAKLGKFRSNFGKFNRTHPPETPFADRPLAAERFLGEEGLSGMGASVSWLAPLPFYLNFDGEVTNTPDSTDVPAFAEYRGKDLMYLARASTFFDLGETTNLTLGGSYANGANGPAETVDPIAVPDARRAQLYGGDATFRWKNPRRAIYRSLTAQLEWMARDPDDGPRRTGGFAWADYQFARRWHLGARYDWSQAIDAIADDTTTGGLGFLTFTPSEFWALSLQGQDRDFDGSAMSYFFKTTFNIGPHGQHPF